MANKIVFHYNDMDASVTNINTISTNYVTAGTTLVTALANATANWEGPSKEKFMAFVNGAVKKHIVENVPAMIKGTATLLANNIASMQEADEQVGNKMPTSL